VSRIRIGTRGSALALWQAGHAKQRLEALGHEVSLHPITTTGDRLQDRRLEAVGGKGAFLKEIEEALLAGEVDLAVHSLKDVPTALPAGLVLAAFLERADPRDALVSGGPRLDALPSGARVGTTSLRRRALVLAVRPDLVLEDLRGLSSEEKEAGDRRQERGIRASNQSVPSALEPPPPPPTLEPQHQRVYDALTERKHADELARALDLPVGDLARLLMQLEMKKVVRRLPGNLYERR
jgi:hypothetical protein